MPVDAELAIEDLVPGFVPESDLERAITGDRELLLHARAHEAHLYRPEAP